VSTREEKKMSDVKNHIEEAAQSLHTSPLGAGFLVGEGGDREHKQRQRHSGVDDEKNAPKAGGPSHCDLPLIS
jgi:hypothetical protein